MGFDDPAFDASDEELARAAVAGARAPLDTVDFERLRAVGWAEADLPEDFRPFAQGGFGTPSGRLRLWSEDLPPGFDPPPGDDEPLALMTVKSAHHFLNSTYANLPRHLAGEGEPLLDLHADDAAARGIADGDVVRVQQRPRRGRRARPDRRRRRSRRGRAAVGVVGLAQPRWHHGQRVDDRRAHRSRRRRRVPFRPRRGRAGARTASPRAPTWQVIQRRSHDQEPTLQARAAGGGGARRRHGGGDRGHPVVVGRGDPRLLRHRPPPTPGRCACIDADATPTQNCATSEATLTWNQQGPHRPAGRPRPARRQRQRHRHLRRWRLRRRLTVHTQTGGPSADIFLALDGIPGDSTTPTTRTRSRSSPSRSWPSARPRAPAPRSSPRCAWTRSTTSSSPKLFAAATSGRHIKSAMLTFSTGSDPPGPTSSPTSSATSPSRATSRAAPTRTPSRSARWRRRSA